MSEFTHAGGVVFRREDAQLFYLVIAAKNNSQHWVLPKGHIEPGESPEEAAKREVREETGIEANALEPIGDIRFVYKDRTVKTVFFLMEYVHAVDAAEDRKKRWCTYDEAMKLLTFADSIDLMRKAHESAMKQ